MRDSQDSRFNGLRTIFSVGVALLDFLMIRLAFVAAYALRQVGDPLAERTMGPLSRFNFLVLVYAVVIMAVLAMRGLYIPRRGLGRVDMLYQVAIAVGIGWLACLAGTVLATRNVGPPRLMLIYWGFLTVFFVWVARVLADSLLREARRKGRDLLAVLIVGNGQQAQLVDTKVREAPELGYRVAGFIGEAPDGPLGELVPVFGGLAEVPRIVQQNRIGEVIIAWPGLDHRDLIEIVAACTRLAVNIKIFPDFFELMAREAETSELTGLPLMRVRDVALRGWSRFLKRSLDLTLSTVLLVLLSPILLLVSLMVKLSLREASVFYVQERVGLDGQPFQIIKFRSMRPDAEEGTGAVWAVPNDPRRTRLGAIIRRFSIDELPQLINVLLGEMSLVGPRPERPEFVAQFARAVPRYQDRHSEKAGMTGWAQVNGQRGMGSIEERTKYDLFYVENWSLAFDVKILLKTIAAVLRDRNAY